MANNYTNKTEVELELGVHAATLLSDISDEVLSAMIEKQSRIIDQIIDEQVEVPFDDIDDDESNLPDIIAEICTGFVKYKIWNRMAAKDIPEHIQKDYEAKMKLLEDIRKGLIHIGALTDDDADRFEWDADDKYFTEDLN